MKTDVDTALKDIADWYIKNRRELTEPELEGILKKHVESEAEAEKFVSFLGTEPGQTRFKIHLRERKESKKPSTLKDNPAKVTWATPNSDDAAALMAKLKAIGASPTLEWREWPSPAWYIETKPLSPSEWTRAKQIVAEFNSSTLKERKGGNPTQSPRLGNLGTPSDLYSKIVGSFIKSEQLIEEAWAENKMSQVIEFHGLKLENDIKRQIAFLQAFLKATQQKQLGKG